VGTYNEKKWNYALDKKGNIFFSSNW
jgi:hypothetical protein